MSSANGTAEPTFPRLAGMLLPLSALPGRHGVGDLGPEAHRLVAWLAKAGVGWWQMLPVGPIGPGDSPYSSSSAFAGEALYLSLERLVVDGLLTSADIAGPKKLSQGKARYDEARSFKRPRLATAFARWKKQGGGRSRVYAEFCADQAGWLDAWCEYAAADEHDLAFGDPELARFLQYQFERQWRSLRVAASEANLRLMGDVPIFVGLDSADVTSRPELFRLDAKGRPTVVTGCPPDGFSDDGQLWGHPHYAWDAHRDEDFAWWRARVGRQLELFDAVRIDHFIGFQQAWEVPRKHRTARRGEWGASAGREVLTAIVAERGDLPLVAEDLGAVTPEVLALRDDFGLPGMRILHWGFWPDSEHAPHHVPENSVVYPGTHDNDTTVGWWKDADAGLRRRIRAHTGGGQGTIAWDVWRTACATSAHTAIIQLQDLLGLGRAARMNLPGTVGGNWAWRYTRRDLGAPLARRLHELIDATDRLPHE